MVTYLYWAGGSDKHGLQQLYWHNNDSKYIAVAWQPEMKNLSLSGLSRSSNLVNIFWCATLTHYLEIDSDKTGKIIVGYSL